MRRWNDGRLRPSRSRCVLERLTRASGLTIQGAVNMQLGMIGLGRMGGNMVRRLLQGGHTCVVFDSQPASVAVLADQGATGSHSLAEFVKKLDTPRAVWLMLPAAGVE